MKHKLEVLLIALLTCQLHTFSQVTAQRLYLAEQLWKLLIIVVPGDDVSVVRLKILSVKSMYLLCLYLRQLNFLEMLPASAHFIATYLLIQVNRIVTFVLYLFQLARCTG